MSFEVTSEELTLDIDDFAARLLNPAMMAIVQKVDTDIANKLSATATGPGGGGTATIASVGSDPFLKAREILTRNKFPVSGRNGVLSPEATSSALADPLFVQAQQAGTTDALRNANVGRAFGIDTYESGQLGYGAGAAGEADGLAFHTTAVTLASPCAAGAVRCRDGDGRDRIVPGAHAQDRVPVRHHQEAGRRQH